MGSAEKIKLIAVVMAVAVLVSCIVSAVLFDRNAKREEARLLYAYQKETQELADERQELEIELANIEKVVYDSLGDGSYIGLVFSEIDAELYDLFLYHFKDKLSFSGMLCISDEDMPGEDGLISFGQYLEMKASGWQTAVYWDGEGELPLYLLKVRALCEMRGMAFPETVVFAPGKYTAAYDTVLEAHGIKNAVHHGEENRGLVEKGVEGEIWHPGALSWNTIGFSNAMLVEVINHGGVALFEVNFSGGHETNYDFSNSERVESFGRMLRTLESCIATDEILIIDLETAKEGRRSYLDCEEEALLYIEERSAEIVARIDSIDAVMAEKYREYFGN